MRTRSGRMWLLCLAVLACLGSAGAAEPVPARAVERVRLAVGGKAGFHYLPLTIATRLGYFRDEGLDVEIDDFPGGAKALQALLGGSADVVAGGYESLIDLQAKGQFLRAFVLIGHTPQIAIGVGPAHQTEVASIAGFKGLKVGVSAPGSSTHVTLNLVLAEAGLAPGDVAVVGVGTGQGAVNAVESGQIDAIASVEPVITILESRGKLRVLADARTRAGTLAVYGGPLPSAALSCETAYLQSHPQVVQGLTNAMVRAERWLARASTDEVVAVVPREYQLGDEVLYRRAFEKVREGFATDGLFPDGGPQTALRVAQTVDRELDISHVRLEDTFTNDFARRADQRYP